MLFFSATLRDESGEKEGADMIRGAIFDADGTLLDSMGAWDVAAVNYLADLGVQARPDLKQTLFPLTLAECAVYLRQAYGLSRSPAQIEAEIREEMRLFYRDRVKAKPGAKAFLEALRDRGVRLTLATNTPRSAITEGLGRTGLLPLLDGIFTTAEMGMDKHDPAFFHAVRQAMGTGLEDTWVFEDAVHAAATAYSAGYHVAGVADPYSDQEALRKVCHIYLPELTDFMGFWTKQARL